jgi:peptidoglycan hydrolase-like protein with peptidoglycan-binding domain
VRPRHDLSDPTPWRRSLRASQARRAAAATHRRRSTRSRGAVTAALLGLSVLATGAMAEPASRPANAASSAAAAGTTQAAQAALGIAADGIAGPQTRRAVKRFQRSQGLPVSGTLTPQTLAALGVQPDTATAASRSAASTAAQSAGAPALLESIALCESGGDPTAVSPSGTYRGKYQFSRATWKALGGSGDPAAAPEAEQDAMAEQLMAEQGPSAWPSCSKQVGAA